LLPSALCSIAAIAFIFGLDEAQGRPKGFMSRFCSALAIAFSILFCANAFAENGCPAGTGIVCTEQGAIRGAVEGGTLAFKGIPYAEPPLGQLRWKPPQPATPWQGIRDGSQYSAICPQIVGKDVKGDEDCLYVNVWRPREKSENPLPVMIWLTGGGNHSLSGQGSAGFGGVVYSGEQVVPEGVVFVSYNLRLGALGFLAHPALDAERVEKISGNYGSLDQVGMLEWVHRNIAAFGGDPSRVFLFGTSAGGGNICALMTSPRTRGLFHGVAMQSSVPAGCEIQTLSDAENGTGARVAKALGCDGAADVAACLRGKSMNEIVSAVPGNFSVLPRAYGPNVDGYLFPDQPINLIERKRYPAMPVIVGNTTEETLGWADTAGQVVDEASYSAAVDKVFGAPARDRILALYPASAFPSPRRAFAQVTTDAEFTCKSRRVARTFADAQKEPVYRYLFNHRLDNDPTQKALGAAHTIEHPFLFAWKGSYRPSETDREVQRQLVDYWTRMAKAGNPNGAGDPNWPSVSANGDEYIEIGAATGAKTGPAKANCDFWDSLPLLWPHI
jgi:para-nitrobenzyl esterase